MNGSFGRFSRRTVFASAASGAVGLGLVACSSNNSKKNAATTAATRSAGTTASSPGPGSVSGAATAARAAAATPGAFGVGAAPTPTVAANARRGGSINAPHAIGLLNEPLDPHRSITIAANVWAHVGDLAIYPHPNGRDLIPQLIGKWEIPGDGSEFIFTARQGVKWQNRPPSNGRLLNADDIAFNLMRIAGKLAPPDQLGTYPRSPTLPNLDSATATDDKTVHVKLTQPNSTFLAGISDYRNQFVPKDYVDGGGDFKDITRLVGTGPFTCESFQDGVQATFKRNPEYWDQGLPYLDQVKRVWVTDRLSAIASFIKGDFPILEEPNRTELQTVQSQVKDVYQSSWLNAIWNHWRFNLTRQPFGDPRVRKAFQLVTDFKKAGDSIYGADNWAFTGPCPATFGDAYTPDQIGQMPGFNPSTKAADIKNAKDMLAAAGFPDGKGINFKVTTSQGLNWYDHSVRGIDDLKTAFPQIQVDLDVVPDITTLVARQGKSDFDVVAYRFASAPDALQEMIISNYSKGTRNYGKFADPQIDDLLIKAQAQFGDQRKQSMLQAQKLLLDQHMPAIPQAIYKEFMLFKNNLQGFSDYGAATGGGTINTQVQTKRAWLAA